VLFVVAGGLLVIGWPRLAWAHIPAVVWGAWVEFSGWVCPLTPMENWLRQQAGQAVSTASFVDRYVLPVLYPPALSRETQWLLGAFVLGVNAGMYLAVLRRRVSGPRPANRSGGPNVLQSD
jgi:hypothetical protein